MHRLQRNECVNASTLLGIEFDKTLLYYTDHVLSPSRAKRTELYILRYGISLAKRVMSAGHAHLPCQAQAHRPVR